MRNFRGGTARSSNEALDKGVERRGCAMEPDSTVNPKGEEPMNEAKPFLISKREVWDAYQRVKANKGAAGIDEQSIAEFERNLKDNLYKLWNRMASGSYFPPPVHQSAVSESVSALCVRCVDGAAVSASAVRKICRRCHRALQEQT